MNKILVVVESVTKIKKIQHFLGSNYLVVASCGHIIDLDPGKLSIDIDNNFKPQYKTLQGKSKIINNLKNMSNNTSDILLATDIDREGEMIAWSVAHTLKLKNPKRIIFNAITKSKLLQTVKNPIQINYNIVNAQKTRRILDRLVGYKISPLVQKKLNKNRLSVGRVQSIVTKLIIDKEDEVNKFFLQEECSYFKFKGIFIAEKNLAGNLHDFDNINENGFFKGNIAKLKTKKKSLNFLKKCMTCKFKIANILNKTSKKNPSPPFTTSTLQQEASKKLGFSVKKTMIVAQKLYEEGLITYMRTDSLYLSKEALENIKKYVLKTYGNNYYQYRIYKTKNKSAQEAHEAIRPTDVFVTPSSTNNNKIGNDELKLYSLIWKRTVASQMQSAEFNIIYIQISISKIIYYFFQIMIEKMIFMGFFIIYNLNYDTKNNEEDVIIPKIGQELKVNKIIGTQEYRKPPSRYNEASLIKKIENLEIGRPSTYAPLINKIKQRDYVIITNIAGEEKNSLTLIWNGKDKINENTKKIKIGKEKNKFMPTELGKNVNSFLIQNFPKIMEYKFTANMESKLNDIALGKIKWCNVLKNFYDELHPQISKLMISKPIIENKLTKILGKDHKTGVQIIATIGKYTPIVKTCPLHGKPKIGAIYEPLTLDTITLDDALKILEYPIELGKYKRNNVFVKYGKYGHFIESGKNRISIDNKNITLEEAIKKFEERQKKILGKYKSKNKNYIIFNGCYGPYILVTNINKKNKFTISLPPNTDIDKLTLKKVEDIVSKNNKYTSKNNKKID